MTDEELAEIEEWFRVGTIYGFTKQGSVEAAGKAHSLIAEVRRLKAENRALQSRLDLAEGRVEGMRKVSLEYIGRLPPSIFTEDDL